MFGRDEFGFLESRSAAEFLVFASHQRELLKAGHASAVKRTLMALSERLDGVLVHAGDLARTLQALAAAENDAGRMPHAQAELEAWAKLVLADLRAAQRALARSA